MTATPVISLFSGAMGLDLGLELSGIETTLAVELDKHCCSTIRQNRPELDVWEADISALSPESILKRHRNPDDVFLMVGGPPCQSFSSGGKRAGLSDPRGNLIYVYLKLIEAIRPRHFALENVANLVTAAIQHRPIAERPGKNWNLSSYTGKGKPSTDEAALPMRADELSGTAIRQLIADVRKLGYHFNFSIVDAADYGAAQHRFRFILLGSRVGSAPLLPPPTHGDLSENGTLTRTVRDAIGDLRGDPGPHSEYTPDVARYFALVPAGGNWRSLPRELQKQALGDAAFAAGGGKTGFYRRLSWDAPSPTITGRSNRKGSAMCHPEAVRPLSVRECARLQGFPDDWTFSGAMNQQYLQIGNAVPVPLGRAIGQAILTADQQVKRKVSAFDVEAALDVAVKRLRASARNKRTKTKKKPEQPTLF
jgi:DNA (cytosine-5)-methyltransferase 1